MILKTSIKTILIMLLLVNTAYAIKQEFEIEVNVTWRTNGTFEIYTTGGSMTRFDCEQISQTDPKDSDAKMFAQVSYNGLNIYPLVEILWQDNTTYKIQVKNPEKTMIIATYDESCQNYPNNHNYNVKFEQEIADTTENRKLEQIQTDLLRRSCEANLTVLNQQLVECKPKLESCLVEAGKCQAITEMSQQTSGEATSVADAFVNCQTELQKTIGKYEDVKNQTFTLQEGKDGCERKLALETGKEIQNGIVAAIIGGLVVWFLFIKKKKGYQVEYGKEGFKGGPPPRWS